MNQVVALIIILLGLINVLRMSTLFILGDVYDFWMHRKAKVQALKRKRKYKPMIDVVIAAFNEEQTIRRCLDSVYKSTYPKFRVIVGNDGSTDKTVSIVEQFVAERGITNLEIVSQPNGGKATILNRVIQTVVTSPLVMTLDADSVLAADALEKVTAYFQDQQVMAVASNVKVLPSQTVLGNIQYIEYLMGYRLKKGYTMLGNEYIVGGIGSTFRRKIMKKVGYYDTDTVTEDIDLTMKIVHQGNKHHKVIYGADVICYTEGVLSLKALFRQRFRWKYGRFQTLFKNKDLFFNRQRRYTKTLTFLQLPFVIYSELTFLFDPLLMGFLVYLSLRFQDVTSFQSIIAFFSFYSLAVIMTDEFIPLKRKLQMALFTPLAYFFFTIISVVEYAGLIKCLLEHQGILKVKEIGVCSWQHVERSGAEATV
jgi:biofilm PGA synthesis N-glycosyltransferase PgaC